MPKRNWTDVHRRRVLQGTASVGATLMSADLQSAAGEPMTGELTADEIRVLLSLSPTLPAGSFG